MSKGTAETKISLPELIERAKKELVKITGLKSQSIVGTFKDEKGWHILLEMLEKKSIPDGMDILATYEAVLNDGELMEFNRKKMRRRMDVVCEEI